MRFLADESCDFNAVLALREAGHDVLAVSEVARGVTDQVVIDLARREKRVLLTEDKDFGQLFFAAGGTSVGVVLIRWPASARRHLRAALTELVEQHANELLAAFVVLEPGKVRFSQTPR
jgi:predicted nuclease of predicted toxin-antitoxin system